MKTYRYYFLTSLTSEFIPQWQLWSKLTRQSNPDINQIVQVFDEASLHAVEKAGGIPFYNETRQVNSFWVRRLAGYQDFWSSAPSGICLVCDLDNFVLKDVSSLLTTIKKYDAVFQIAFGHPREVVESMGFVLCCGQWIISDTHTFVNSAFFKSWLTYTQIYKDDQVALNKLLAKSASRWRFADAEASGNETRLNDLVDRFIQIDRQACIGVLTRKYSLRAKIDTFERSEETVFLHPNSLHKAYQMIGDTELVNHSLETFIANNQKTFRLSKILQTLS